MSTAAPPAPISPNERSAEVLTEKLMGMVNFEGDVEQEQIGYESVKTDIYTADVEGDVVNFAFQISWANRFGSPVPCLPVADGDPIPVSILPEYPAWRQRREWIIDFFYRYGPPSFFSRQYNVEFSYQSTKQATEFFRGRLIRFLTARFSARQSDISTSPGLQFTVETLTSGLRVHYSPAYFFEPQHVLNSPTSPVTGWIQPGRYIFGAGPLGKEPDFDFTAEYDIPPHTSAKLGI
jgi:hypothetical protein